MPVFSSVLSDAKEPLQTQTRGTLPEVCILFAGISISIACYQYASDHYPRNHSLAPSITPRDNSAFARRLTLPPSVAMIEMRGGAVW
jgi:hypothetical protein